MNFFKSMVEDNLLDTSIDYHVQSVQFSFMGLLQKDLDDVKDLWNYHRIRRVHNSVCQPGIPDILYFAPGLSAHVDYSIQVDHIDLNNAYGVGKEPETFGCNPEFLEFAGIVMRERNLQVPRSIEDATELYITLVEELKVYDFVVGHQNYSIFLYFVKIMRIPSNKPQRCLKWGSLVCLATGNLEKYHK